MRSVIWAALVLAGVACGSKDHASPAPVDPTTGAGGSGGTEGTGGTGGEGEDAAADAEIVPCGTKSCNVGEYCCDGTCGACIAVGMNCPLDPCGTGTEGGTTTDDAAAE
jgi:hypothetical protein